ncbi:MAG: CPBP family intramembrane glutamic endopeptidase [Armatimonadota bacterium]|nr:CPBP family intramembrane glutamic endopeptidase [Armatimonadota bacterium]
MPPAAIYPVPPTSETALLILVFFLALGGPFYVLVLRPVRGERTWGLAEMAAMAVLFILTLPLAASALGIGLPLGLRDLSLVTIVQNALLAGVPAYVAMRRYGLPAASLGLRADGWPRHAGVGLAAAAVVVGLSVAGEHAAVYLLGLVEGPQQAALRAAAEHADDPLLPVLGTLSGPGPVAWFFLLVCVVVPVGEEIFFRGFVYGGLRARWGVPVAVLASALFFAAVHLQLVHGLPIFLLGVVFAWVYQRTGSLVPAIVAHGLNNLIAVLSLWRGWGI